MLEVSGRDVLEALPLSSRHSLGPAHTAALGAAPRCADRDRADGRTFLARAAARPAAAERRALSFAVHLKCRRSVFWFFFPRLPFPFTPCGGGGAAARAPSPLRFLRRDHRSRRLHT